MPFEGLDRRTVRGVLVVAVSLLGFLNVHARAQVDRDADRRALVDRLTLERAEILFARDKRGEERERELFHRLGIQNTQLRKQESALRKEAANRATALAKLNDVTAALAKVDAQRQALVDQLSARDRQFAAEIGEYRRQMASLATSPDPRKRAALQEYADGNRKAAFAVLDAIDRADIKAMAAGTLELGALALDMKDRGEQTAADVIEVFERALRLDPEVYGGWVELARLYTEVGKLPEARRAAEESLKRAGNDRTRAIGLVEVGDTQFDAGELAGARARYAEAVSILRTLAAAKGSTGRTQLDLALGLERLSYALVRSGDLSGARAGLEEALWLREGVSGVNPSSEEAVRDVGRALGNLADVLARAGLSTEARARLEQSIAIHRRLLAASPNSIERQSGLALNLYNLGDVLLVDGQGAAARVPFEESLAIARRLAAADPSSALAQNQLSRTLTRLGDVLMRTGDLASARERLEESLPIARSLTTANPTDVNTQRDLRSTLFSLSNVLSRTGQVAVARPHLQETVAVARRVVAADPTNAADQRALSDYLRALGTMLGDAGEYMAARTQLEESVSIARLLAAANPSDIDVLRVLSASLGSLGAALAATADMPSAVARFRENLSVAQRVLAANPSNIQARNDLVWAHILLGRAGLTSYLVDALTIAEGDPTLVQILRDEIAAAR